MRTEAFPMAPPSNTPHLAWRPPSPAKSGEKGVWATEMSVAEHHMSPELTSINDLSRVRSVWKRVFWGGQAVVTGALVVALYRMCDWNHLSAIWTSGDPRLWLVYVVFLNLSLLAGGLALLVLIRGDGKKLPAARFLLDYAHVQSLSQITPGQMGEALLPYMHSSATIPPGTIAAGLLLQRIVAVLIVSVIAVSFASAWMTPSYIATQVGAVGLCCIAIASLIGHEGARARFNAFVGRRYGPILSGFFGSWVKMLQEKRLRRLLPHVFLMVFRFAAMVMANYVMFLSFGISIPVFVLTGTIAVAVLATIIPISFGGLGIVEGVMVLSLGHAGVSSEEVLSVCVMGRCLSIFSLLNWSFLFWVVGWSEFRSNQPAA